MTLLRRTDNGFPVLTNWLEDIFSTVDSPIAERTKNTLPSVNIMENNDVFHIDFAAPGLKKDDFGVDINNNVLTVKSELNQENEEKGNNYTRREFNYASFQRSFTLPDSVDSDKIKASYQNGILSMDIPKKEEAKVKPVRKINIM